MLFPFNLLPKGKEIKGNTYTNTIDEKKEKNGEGKRETHGKRKSGKSERKGVSKPNILYLRTGDTFCLVK